MLDYFNTREQLSSKSPILRKPHISQGISIESPQEFQQSHSMICQTTFVNPYITYEKDRKPHIPVKKLSTINPAWTKKIDINQLETQKSFQPKIIRQSQLSQLSPQNRYKKELSESKARFRLIKGEFSNFIERNHSNSLFGPLQGRERNQNKSLLTRKQLAQKSRIKLSQNFDRLTQYSSRLFEMKEGPFQQKHLLERQRHSFREGHKKQLQKRKNRQLDLYALPQLLNSSRYSSSRYKLEDTGPKSDRQFEQSNPQLRMTLLSDKSIEKLNELKEFGFTKRYFTIDANVKWGKSSRLESIERERFGQR